MGNKNQSINQFYDIIAIKVQEWIENMMKIIKNKGHLKKVI